MTDSNQFDRNQLKRLKELPDFKVAHGYPDIRGWAVKTRDGRRLGKVHDLIVNTAEMRVRYLDVDTDDAGNALVPIGIAQLDQKHDDVIVHELSSGDLAIYPRYSRKDGIDRSYESAVWQHFAPDRGAGAAGGTTGSVANSFGYDSERYDDARMANDARARSAAPADNTATRGLMGGAAIGSAGAMGAAAMGSTPMTAGSTSASPQRHEEITIERQAITDINRTAEVLVTESEIRIPLMAEWADGRRMPREEVIIRKRMVSGAGDPASIGQSTMGHSSAQGSLQQGGLADRAADKVDDLKDRVDGNPASRPGRDLTDRPGR